MKITDIRLYTLSVPLRVPFKTALRTVNSVEDVIVEILTDTGNKGYGEAPPTGPVTGDTTVPLSVQSVIISHRSLKEEISMTLKILCSFYSLPS